MATSLKLAGDPILYIFSGLPGTGKSSLSRRLSTETKAVYVCIDTVEQSLRSIGGLGGGFEGYIVCYRLAEDNLRLGGSVVADSVNPLKITRDAWREVAHRARARYVEIETVCSDEATHRNRIEKRSPDVEGLILHSWEEVVTREYLPWHTDRVVIDTAFKSIDQSMAELRTKLFDGKNTS